MIFKRNLQVIESWGYLQHIFKKISPHLLKLNWWPWVVIILTAFHQGHGSLDTYKMIFVRNLHVDHDIYKLSKSRSWYLLNIYKHNKRINYVDSTCFSAWWPWEVIILTAFKTTKVSVVMAPIAADVIPPYFQMSELVFSSKISIAYFMNPSSFCWSVKFF